VRSWPVFVLAAACACFWAACVDRLPDQDRRILGATPVAKLPVADLSKEFQASRADANRKYWGKAVEVTGDVSASAPVNGTTTSLVFADKSGAALAEAWLLDDQAAAIVAGLAQNRRVRLKCYCEGLTTKVVLKSCVRP
jgi:hypothetical protein